MKPLNEQFTQFLFLSYNQIDFTASFAKLLNIPIKPGEAKDSENHLNAFMGKLKWVQPQWLERYSDIAIVCKHWKYIPENKIVKPCYLN